VRESSWDPSDIFFCFRQKPHRPMQPTSAHPNNNTHTNNSNGLPSHMHHHHHPSNAAVTSQSHHAVSSFYAPQNAGQFQQLVKMEDDHYLSSPQANNCNNSYAPFASPQQPELSSWHGYSAERAQLHHRMNA